MSVNRISITITDAQKTAVEKAKNDLATATNAFNTVISKQELKSLSRLGDVRIPFVEKVTQYVVSNPEFLPPFADVPEFNKDFETFTDVREMMRPIQQILDNLTTTMQVSGNEALRFARLYYQTVQYSARMGVPGAQTIYDDLRPLFEAKAAPPAPKP